LLKSWPTAGPKIQWRIPLGDGYSGVAISKGKVLTLFSQGNDEFIICLEAKTGKEIWRVRSDSTYKDVNGNGPRSTPTIHGDVVYALGAHGKLYALQAKNGKRILNSNLREAFNGVGPSEGAGYGTSPLIEDEMLALVEATPNEYKEKASAEILTGRSITVPALADGKLYLRNMKELVCLELK